MAAITKKHWFHARDSWVTLQDGQGYYNVYGRFADHDIPDIEASKIARRTVHKVVTVLQTTARRVADNAPAVQNMDVNALRFDRGDFMSQSAFRESKSAIRRFPEAWNHYQTFRRTQRSMMEDLALLQLGEEPRMADGLVLDYDGTSILGIRQLEAETLPLMGDDEAPDEDEPKKEAPFGDDTELTQIPSPAAPQAPVKVDPLAKFRTV